MGGVHHTTASDVFLEDRDQGEDGLHRQPLDGVVYEGDVGPVEDAVQDAGVVAVQALHQELGQGVRPGGARGACCGGGQQGESLLIGKYVNTMETTPTPTSTGKLFSFCF